MEFSNQKRTKKIKRTFNLIGILIVVVGLAFLWLKKDIPFMIMIGIFAAFIGFAQYANLCYISFSTNNGKVLIRYFQVISLLKKNYESIEFPQSALAHFKIEKSMGFADLDIVIKTKRGMAEYPTISLSALNQSEIEQISQSLTEIIKNNRKGS
jgi:hypothetical protein